MCDHARHAGKVDRLLIGLILGLILARFAILARAAEVDADLLLCGGTIHDGSGAESVVGDVAVRDGRIVAVGKVTPGKIGRTLEGRGVRGAPGRIALHTPPDGTLAQLPPDPPTPRILSRGTRLPGGGSMQHPCLQLGTLHSYLPAVESGESSVVFQPETRWYNASSGRANPACIAC